MNDLDKFIVHYIQNSPRIMWLLGAGASRASGIPTAWDIVWELKCRTYCLLQQKTFSDYSDYTSPAIREEVQSFLSNQQEFKYVQPDNEYSFYLEYVYKDNTSGLREFIQEKVKNEHVYPSYGHKFLGILLKQKLCKIIWTTNFDSLIEDGYSSVGGKPTDLNVAELSGSVLAKQALNDGDKSFPLHVKLHGDFRYTHIRNLEEDLQKNNEFSEALKIACNQYGMAVCGYSGRDESVMRYLHSSLEKDNPFPKGLYWFTRPSEKSFQTVQDLISKAQKKGIDARLIEIDNFNELMSRIKKQFTSLPVELVREHLDSRYDAPKIQLPNPSTQYPIIKTNALPIIQMPKCCYAMEDSKINNFEALKEKTKETEQYFPIVFREGKILAFDKKIKDLFEGELKTFQLTEEILGDKDETHILNLLQRNLFNKIVENKPFRLFFKGATAHIVVDYKRKHDSSLLPLTQATQKIHRRNYLCGNIKNTQLHWAESIKLKLNRNLSGFWILLEPDIWIYRGDKEREKYQEEWEEAKTFRVQTH